MGFDKLLDLIRDGKIQIEVADNGLPNVFGLLGIFDQMRFISAMTQGYRQNFEKIRRLKVAFSLAENQTKTEDKTS